MDKVQFCRFLLFLGQKMNINQTLPNLTIIISVSSETYTKIIESIEDPYVDYGAHRPAQKWKKVNFSANALEFIRDFCHFFPFLSQKIIPTK